MCSSDLVSGRSQEIQRLIARSLRAVCDLEALGEREVTVDCDVIQADGGTRTASICGGFIALHDALERLVIAGGLAANPLTDQLAAISVGIVEGEARLDLPYIEDSTADVDFNVVMTGSGRFVEVQGTAEGEAFDRAQLDALVDLDHPVAECLGNLDVEVEEVRTVLVADAQSVAKAFGGEQCCRFTLPLQQRIGPAR